MKLLYPLFFCLIITQLTVGQVTNSGLMNANTGEQLGNLSIGAYIDAYFGYDFSRPASGDVPYFVSSNRHNEASINLAFLDVRYNSERIRGSFVPGFGTYMNSNYQIESGSLKNLVEANVGYKMFKDKEIWVDFGILGSPYTNESAVSRDHLMYTRSFAPEYVPYYLAGAKISMPLSEKVTAYLYLLNGWQQIRDQNRGKSVGTQLEFRPNSKNLFNWNTYLGDERTAERPNDRLRAFSDLYWIYDSGKNWDFTSCTYGGFQNNLNEQFTKKVFWWQANFIARYSFSEKTSVSGRLEYFSDPNAIQITSEILHSKIQMFSKGICFNFSPEPNLLLRLEARHFNAGEEIFKDASQRPSSVKFWLVSNVTFSF